MVHTSTEHEVLAVVFQVGYQPGESGTGKPKLNVLLWHAHSSRNKAGGPRRAAAPDEDLITSVRRQLAEKVDLREIAHLEQLAIFSDPHRVPGRRTIASTFLGLVPPRDPELPPDTRWHPVNDMPPMAFDHGTMVAHAQARLVAKLSYTNIGFALAPKDFALSSLRDIYGAALGYQVDATNLQRVLARRGVITRTGTTTHPAVPAAGQRRCTGSPTRACRVTDEFAALRATRIAGLDSYGALKVEIFG